jgi:hypothetical protein
MAVKFFACPTHRCRAPGRFFTTEADVLAFARQAATAYDVTYAAWRVHVGQWTMLGLARPDDPPDDPDPTRHQEG